MSLSPSQLLSNDDMEQFALDFLGLSGVDADMYYESYYEMDVEHVYEEEEYRDEINQTKWQY